jgi:hypothetical protein
MYATATKTAKKVAEETDCGSDSENTDGEEDSRSMGTKHNLIKNKLRAIGLKMSYEPEGEVIDETHLGVKASLTSMRSKTKRPGMDYLAKQQNSADADLGRQKNKKILAQQANQENKRKSKEEYDDEDYNNHPSLDARGRNPSMR